MPSKRSKNSFLLLSSYVFYGYWDWRFCGLLAISTVIDFLVGSKLYKSKNIKVRKTLLLFSLTINLGILGIFKYYNFFIDSFEIISANIGWQIDYLHVNILLPVGISFYTFQTLSYTIDIYRRRLKPTRNFIDFALFVAFFPQLVAGPIERAKSLLPQLASILKPSRSQIKQGLTLIVMGLFRKVLIGDTAGRFVDHIFGNIEQYKSIEVIAALFLFSIQIYADFSGYSHIARGTAKLVGVELMRNFEQPYLARNITEFWRRWHISLSSWLRDYLYISLGGNRRGTIQTYTNLMLTMLLGGLWHGASWNFAIWGGLHGIYLSIHKYFLSSRTIVQDRMVKLSVLVILRVIITYLLVTCTWLFFRATSWDTTRIFINKVIIWEESEHTAIFVSTVLTYMLVVLLVDIIEYSSGKHSFLLGIKSKGVQYGILFAMLVVTFIYMFQANSLPFIYFQF